MDCSDLIDRHQGFKSEFTRGKKRQIQGRQKRGFVEVLYRKCPQGASWKDVVHACQLGSVRYRRRK